MRSIVDGVGKIAILAMALVLGYNGPISGQSALLAEAVQLAQEAWLQHDVRSLVARSDTLRLHIPDLPPSASLRPGQASRLLNRYLSPTEEGSFELLNVRELADDHAYAEFKRIFVVKGTVEERVETVFFGFRRIDGSWKLREVRVTP